MKLSFFVALASLGFVAAAPAATENDLVARGGGEHEYGKCPDKMRWNPKTQKCYSPERHPSEDNCKYLGKCYDEHSKQCYDCPQPHPPEPPKQECPKGMRYNPSTKKCYSPERHPSEDNCKWLGKCYDAHKWQCVECYHPEPPKHNPEEECKKQHKCYDAKNKCCIECPKPPPPPPQPKPDEECKKQHKCYNYHEHKCEDCKPPPPPPNPAEECKKQHKCYNYHEHKCEDCKPPPPPPNPAEECKKQHKCYNYHEHKCEDCKPPPPPPNPEEECKKQHKCYNWHTKKCEDCPKPPEPPKTDCPKGMRYNPSTKKCYSPERHPSEDNCKYLGKCYDAHKKQCVDCYHPEPPKEECPKGMRYNPSTKKCYSPERHPSEDNCKYLGKCYDSHKKVCYDCHEQKPDDHGCKDGQHWDEHEKCCKY